MEENPSILSHISLGTNDIAKAAIFYDAALKTVGAKRVMEFPGAIAYGKAFPEFWIQTPIDGEKAAVGNGTHVGFFANSPSEVDAFYKAALDQGGTCDGPPGPRPEYSDTYYGCFVRDPDGHKVEAMFWDMNKSPEVVHD